MKRPLTRVVLAVCIPVGLLLSACGFGGFTHSNTTDVPAPADAAGATDSPAATETSPPPQLIATDRTGVTAVQKLVNKADTVVVASKTNLGAGAQKAKELQAPLLIDDGTNTDAIATEIKRLKAKEERVADADPGASTAPSTPSTSAAPSAPSTSGAPTSAQTTAAAAGPTVAQLLAWSLRMPARCPAVKPGWYSQAGALLPSTVTPLGRPWASWGSSRRRRR